MFLPFYNLTIEGMNSNTFKRNTVSIKLNTCETTRMLNIRERDYMLADMKQQKSIYLDSDHRTISITIKKSNIRIASKPSSKLQ